MSNELERIRDLEEQVSRLSDENKHLQEEIESLEEDVDYARQDAREWENQAWDRDSDDHDNLRNLVDSLKSEWANSFDLMMKADELSRSEDPNMRTMAKLTLKMIHISRNL